MAVTGIILAGGKSSRMGSDKGLLPFKGKPLVAYSIEVLTGLTDELMIVANNPDYERFGLPVYKDIFPDKGPLGGICTGLHFSASDVNIVLSCDTPFVSQALLEFLLENSKDKQITVPVWKGRIQPLVGLYHKSSETELIRHLEAGQLAMHKVISQMPHEILDIHNGLRCYEPELFFNINRPEDLEIS